MSQLTHPLPAGRRALALVEAVSRDPDNATFSRLAETLQLSGASLSRLLKMLVDEDWLRHARPSGRYELGHRTLRLAYSLHGQALPDSEVQNVVAGLAQTTGHSACIAVIDNDRFMLVSKFEIRHSHRLADVFVPSANWISNGLGQFLLAFQPRETVSGIYRRNFDIDVPDEHWRRFETIRSENCSVSSDTCNSCNGGRVTRVMAGIAQDRDSAVTSVCAIAAPGPEPVEVGQLMPHVRHFAAEAARRMAASRNANGQRAAF